MLDPKHLDEVVDILSGTFFGDITEEEKERRLEMTRQYYKTGL